MTNRPQCVRIKVQLDDATDPRVMRVLDIADDMPLDKLHDLIQVTMGWENRHLHLFATHHPRRFPPAGGPARPVIWVNNQGLDESDSESFGDSRLETATTVGQALKHANGRLFYEYDFGDSWVHSIEAAPGANHLEGRVARLIYAEGRCPFEDVGGTSGWLAFKEAVADPSLPRAAELRSWAGLSPDPTDRFDPDEVDTESITRGIDLLAMLEQPGFGPGSFGHALVDGIDRSVAVKFLGDTAWDAPLDPLSDDQLTKFIRPVQWLIRRIGEGIKLTSAGWLPTALVAEAAAEFGVPDWSPQAAKTESKNIPLQELRGTMTRSRLLRRDQGWLRPTRAALAAADHPSAMFDLFAARFRPGGRRSDRAAAIALAAMLLQVQAGHGQNSERVGEAILEALGCHDYWFECNPNEAGNYAFGMVYPEWRTLLALAEPWTMEGCAWPFAEPAVKHFARQVLASPA